MELSLFEYLGIGLAVAIVLIPIARWFWKRFDLPSKRAVALMEREAEEGHEKAMWASIEAQVEAETQAVREYEMKQKAKQDSAGRTLDEAESDDAWTKLGIDIPIQPVAKIEAPPVVLSKPVEEVPEEEEPTSQTEEPDWELVERMEKLSNPLEGVPEAPDLNVLDNEQMDEPVKAESEVVEEEPKVVEEEPEAESKPVSKYTQDGYLDWDVEW
ncbi:MAG: hypothetical protein NZ737_02910 [Candidatus Poseidoniaceae archaeon]|nr:hypothetical protein [Candidatus Poseidoniaceae archaeon]